MLGEDQVYGADGVTGESEPPTIGMLAALFITFVWMVTFVDTDLGDLYLKENQIIVEHDEASLLRVVSDAEEVVPKKDLENMRVVNGWQQVVDRAAWEAIGQEAADQRRAREQAERDAAAFGFGGVSGGREALVVLVDLTLAEPGRAAVCDFIRGLDHQRLTVLGYGDGLRVWRTRLRAVDDDDREAACQAILAWPHCRQRLMLDAVDGAWQLDGVTSVLLAAGGLPIDGEDAVWDFLSRRTVPAPINTLDCSGGDGPTALFLQSLAERTDGRYSQRR